MQKVQFMQEMDQDMTHVTCMQRHGWRKVPEKCLDQDQSRRLSYSEGYFDQNPYLELARLEAKIQALGSHVLFKGERQSRRRDFTQGIRRITTEGVDFYTREAIWVRRTFGLGMGCGLILTVVLLFCTQIFYLLEPMI